MLKEVDTKLLMSQTKFYDSYSRWNDDEGRYETWEEAVTRVMNMHRQYYKNKMTPELSQIINEAESLYKLQYALGAQRALQFGGDQLLKHQMRMYNCTSSYADRTSFFQEYFYILLCGAGAGFSVQKHHIKKIPNIHERKKQAKGYVVEDSIEGWADALGVLLSSFFEKDGSMEGFVGRKVYFDLTNIRPKGSSISGGFKAPGPEPLRRALDRIEHLIQGRVLKGHTKLRPIDVYDISMHTADAVLAGGVRRSATICLFDADDEEMANAKTGNWFVENPQRARSNNSAVIVRDEITREGFSNLMKTIKEFGEPGFYFVSNKDHTTNPCVEIGMFPQIKGKSGWQGCNLTEINGGKCTTEDEFFKACRAGAILGTLQAGYTDFKYLPNTSKKIFDREALLGVSVTGWMNNPKVLLNAEVQKRGAEIVKTVNEEVAKLIGVNPAARTTCVKPSGNASVLLQTASGIHAEHSPHYLRNVQLNKESEVAQLIAETNPYMAEESVWSTNKTDYVISFPVVSKEGSIYKEELYGKKLLEGTREELCVDPTVRHNVSNTVTVLPNQWADVENYLFENRYSFAGVSFLAGEGDKDYAQAPFTSILTEGEIVEKYGAPALFASGLIVDVHNGFSNLWEACTQAQQPENNAGELGDIRHEWIRRFKKFCDNYFDGDSKQAEYCLKDVSLLHKWTKIQQNLSPIDFVSQLQSKKYTDIDTMASSACVGGVCEVEF
jgi:ribonucleoside-diphosphate reductase alpha chain